MDSNQTDHVPEVTEGYAHTFYPVRWKAYKPNSEQFRRGRKGRWQRMNEYGGWENCEPPNAVHSEPFDADLAKSKVKPLEWDDFNEWGAKAPAWGQGSYLISVRGNDLFEVVESYPGYQGGCIGKAFLTIEAAKAAAQADYERRILGALE